MKQETATIAVSQAGLRIAAITCLALFGLGLVYGIGFAHSHLLHNAAHDVRHSAGFPCH